MERKGRRKEEKKKEKRKKETTTGRKERRKEIQKVERKEGKYFMFLFQVSSLSTTPTVQQY